MRNLPAFRTFWDLQTDPPPRVNPMRRLLWILLLVATATPASGAARLRAEFEDHEALLVGCANLLFHHPATLVQLAGAVHADMPIFGLVSNAAQADSLAGLLHAHGIAPDRIEPVFQRTEGMWVRDYGPLFVIDGAGLVMVDARYRVQPDDTVPTVLAEEWGIAVADTPLWAEGGHLVHNGRGLLLVSTTLARLNAGYDGIGAEQIRQRLRSSVPFREARWVEPLDGEPTGHLDMFLVFVGPGRLVVASMDPAAAPAIARRLDAAADRFAAVEVDDAPLEILRVPTPPPDGDVWYSYTNVILIGDQVLVPQYDGAGPDANRRALEFWREAMPGREVDGIDASSLIRRHGALHCISMPLPLLPGS